ncbi:type II toxin-antitoxin system RatA family toxin [Candidatus Pelagibacter sp.]|mgnify:FL=1|jgi:coenzyme Q-binding protein COQ10|nr:type II toxin-antitoxin system RatA family toxin [Candidatus Pelagibacter sp.]MDB9700078.1 type II toxin-antitoxin system RatA family toxin [Candidatus Pelagibacter sp.]
MPKASVKRLIECNKEQLIDLVLDIESYPKFIPYCLDAKIYEKKEEKNLILIIADLTIGKGPLKATYKSDVKFNKSTDTIYVTNIEGPLKYLDNKWFFLEKGTSTEITFDIDFEIENKFLNVVMNKSFQYGLDKIADSFQKRANDLFKGR